MWQRALLML